MAILQHVNTMQILYVVLRAGSIEKFSENMYVYVSGGKKCSFFGKFRVLCFLETPVSRFAFLPYSQRYSSLTIYNKV